MARITYKKIEIQTRGELVTGQAAFFFEDIGEMFWESYVGHSEAECLTSLNSKIREKAKQLDELNKP